jgi:hypothetical protein
MRSEHFRQVQLLPSSRIRALRFSRIASTLDAAADAPSQISPAFRMGILLRST